MTKAPLARSALRAPAGRSTATQPYVANVANVGVRMTRALFLSFILSLAASRAVAQPVFAHEATLTPPGAASAGHSVAITADSSRAVVGDWLGAGAAGTVTIYLRTGTSWAREAQVMPPTSSTAQLGWAVGISDDGSVVAAVAPSVTPSVLVFRRTGTSWAFDAVAPMPAATTWSVGSFALSGDATRVFVGGRQTAAPYADRVGVYTLGPGTLTPEATLTRGSGDSGAFVFLATSFDGSRVAFCYSHQNMATSAYGYDIAVFTRSGVTWGAVPEFDSAANYDSVFYRLGMSALGDRIAGYDGSTVATYDRSGTTWTRDAATVPAGFDSPALSGDGTHLFVFTSAHVLQAYLRGAGAWMASSTINVTALGLIRASAASGRGDRVIVGDSATSSGQADVYSLLGPIGTSCAVGAECTSGFCADGFCCNTACGAGSSNDCQACSNALTGVANGTCSALSASVAPTVTCRATAGSCDVAEICSSSSATCPTNAFASSAMVCRAATDTCDLAESCTGSSALCPADALEPSTFVCRSSRGVCDPAETCTGASATCPPEASVVGTVCRPAAGACDVAEVCASGNDACPSNSVVASGVACRVSTGVCDLAESCDGSSATCPTDALAPMGMACGASTGPCDAPHVCTGVSASCPVNFHSAGTVCHMAAGACDSTTTCSGSSASCPSSFVTGGVCRAAAGACDVAESCAGASPDCPTDLFRPATMVCRSSTAACDPAESCTGASVNCPADVNTCPPQPDAGPIDAGMLAHDSGASVRPDAGIDAGTDAARPDGSTASDASAGDIDTGSAPPAPMGSCSCRTSGARSSGGALGGALVVLSVMRRRRRRAWPSP